MTSKILILGLISDNKLVANRDIIEYNWIREKMDSRITKKLTPLKLGILKIEAFD